MGQRRAMASSIGRVVLVTGATRGLGRAVAEVFREEGAQVHVVHRSAAVAGELEQLYPGRVHCADLTEAGAAASVIESLLAQDGQLDALVHAVGPYQQAALEDTDLASFRALMEGNFFSAVQLVDAARQALRAGGGRLVLFGVSGLAAHHPRRSNAAYVASKAALRSYARSLALQEAPHGVNVNMVSPGVIPHAGASVDTLDPELQARIPQGRPGRPEEVASAVRYLCSPEAAHVVGQDIEVAGGYLL
ncbi:MAG: NAD(P)-dependent dehydrogenase (short-subunit alcohol dehydrogenase family) [Planctomycetota bacterium]|jgi:NAD(P)-dependent dehydrogenase (short-subunit alcohol dehydrogenase family)